MNESAKAYLFVQLRVLDRKQFLAYAEAARSIAASYGARYLATGRPLEVLEGEGVHNPIVLTEWPSVEHIRRFWNSPEYQQAIKLRIGAAQVSATIFAGGREVPAALAVRAAGQPES